MKAPADIVGGGKKYSGNGSGDIGCCTVYVGNILVDFDFVKMSRILRVPDEEYRRYLYLVLRDNIASLADCLKDEVEYSTLTFGLISGFTRQLGDLSLRSPDEELQETARKTGKRLTSPKWLEMPGRRTAGRKVKIAEGLYFLAQENAGRGCRAVLVRDGIAEEIIHNAFIKK